MAVVKGGSFHSTGSAFGDCFRAQGATFSFLWQAHLFNLAKAYFVCG